MRKQVYLDSAFKYAAMQSKGLTNKSAAEEMDIPYSTYGDYVNWRNTNKFPGTKYISAIAEYIGWDVDDLHIAILAAKAENNGNNGGPGGGLKARLESLIPQSNLEFSKNLKPT